MLNTDEKQETMFSVLVIADSADELGNLPWEQLRCVCVPLCRTVGEAEAALETQRVSLAVIDQSLAEGGMAALERLARTHPQLPLVLVSDAGDWSCVRSAFIRGAFDCLIRPITCEVAADLVHRLRVRAENLTQGGVFSADRSQAARDLLFGNHPRVLDARPEWAVQGWEAVVVEIVPHRVAVTAIETFVDDCLADSSALGIREYDHECRVLRLTLLFHDRSVERVGRAAFLHIQNLVHQLGETGAWIAAGLGTAGPAEDAAASWQSARLAVGYSLARGQGLHVFRGEQEVAGLVCPALAPFISEFPSRLQGGGDWHQTMDQFFEALAGCVSARRLHQEVQRLFSEVADLVPSSTEVERYYHIVDFVHGPEELRAELEALCERASEAVRTKGRPLADRKLHEFREYVAKHYGDWELDLALVCSVLQISPSYLSKILRRELKTTFVEYVTEVRMTRSRELLSGTDLLTSQIAEQVGFVYTHYFSATFKKRYASTPSEFRAWCRAGTPESAAV